MTPALLRQKFEGMGVLMGARAIAEVHDYEGLQLVLRARAEELGASRMTLDEVSGLQSGYSAKLLCVPPIKRLGPISLGALLQALGLKLIVAEHPEALTKVSRRFEPKKRNFAQPPSMSVEKIVEARLSAVMSDYGKRGAVARNQSLSADQRRKAARRSVCARWARRSP